MPGVALVFDGVLLEPDAGEAGIAERSAVGAADGAAGGGDGAGDAEIGEGLERVAHDRGGGGRSEDARAAHAAGAGIDVEIAIERGEFGLGLLEGAEVLFDVGLRTEQPFLLARPERDADGAARLEPERLDDARGLHHHGRADRVVGGAGGGVPRIEVTAEHDDLVGLVAARNFGDDVVAGFALRDSRG